MTRWRLGWLVLPPTLVPAIGKPIEFNTSCAPVFVQRAGIAGLADAEDFVPGLIGRLQHCRDTLLPQLAALPDVRVAMPDGGMYAFFRVEGQNDSLAFAKRLVTDAGLGLAPGAAFGEKGEGWLRWCFAAREPGAFDNGSRPAESLPHATISGFRAKRVTVARETKARHWSVSPVCASEAPTR